MKSPWLGIWGPLGGEGVLWPAPLLGCTPLSMVSAMLFFLPCSECGTEGRL